MRRKEIEKDYFTPNISEAAFILTTLSLFPSIVFKETGWGLFFFPRTNAVLDAVQKFHAGHDINGLLFSENIKRLKSELLTRRSMNADRQLKGAV